MERKERLTEECWRNLDPWECCGQDNYCQRGCHDEGGCTGGCIVPKLYARLATYEDTGLAPEEVYTLCSMDRRAKMADLLRLEEYQELGTVHELAALLREKKANQPMTLDELREMDEPVWCRVDNCAWIPEGGFWCLCNKGKIVTPSVMQYDCENLDMSLWRFYRRKPEEGNDNV